MKTFLLKIGVFSFFPVVLLIFIEFDIRYNRDNIVIDTWIEQVLCTKKRYMDQHASKIETLILGTSHTLTGLNPNYLNGNAYNFASLSQPLKYDSKLVNYYVDSFVNLKNIIVPISYFTFGCPIEKERVKPLFMFEKTYHWKDDDKLFSDIQIQLIPKQYFRFKIEQFKKKVGISLNNFYSQQTKNEWSHGGWLGRFSEKPITKQQARNRIRFHTEIRTYPQKNAYFSPDIQYINEIIEFAEKKNCKLYFITTPHHKYYRTQINKHLWAENQKIIHELIQGKTNVTYLNFFGDTRFFDNDFDDQDHLNIRGAEKLSKIVNNIIYKE